MQIIKATEIPEAIDQGKTSFAEARRQIEICNACRYCEGYCSVFPAISRERAFSDNDITQLANLCHNCRGCYYACQYTEPHEFSLNIPKVLAEVRQESWQEFATPKFFATPFHHYGTAIIVLIILCLTLFMWLFQTAPPLDEQQNFYSILPHNIMVSLFLPAFLLPIISIAISINRYWSAINSKENAQPLKMKHIISAFCSAGKMKNLSGGHGDGCNFEEEDRFSHKRRWLHHMVMYGFLLCFLSTSVATIMHYAFNLPAPYPLLSLPKLFGISGGVLLSLGTIGLAYLKLKADKNLADKRIWGGEMGFILLLFFVSTSGLVLYAFSGSAWLGILLALHLASVLAFFLLMPFTKMVHGFYRLTALTYDIKEKQQ